MERYTLYRQCFQELNAEAPGKKDTKHGKWQTRLQTLPICDTFKRCASINTATSGRTYALPVAQKNKTMGASQGWQAATSPPVR